MSKLGVAGVACALLLASCSGGNGSLGPEQEKAPEITAKADFSAGGSIGQVWVTDAPEGAGLVLANADDEVVMRGRADRLGSLILRDIAAGDGYTVRLAGDGRVEGTEPFRVLAESDVPDPSLYDDQALKAGLNYVRMRDGVELAMTVRLPLGVTSLDEGPFPTVIEYSGYQVAAPHDLLSALAGGIASGGGVQAPDDPLLPDTSTAVGSLIAPALGYAVVSVQMRGSGCSGGDFQLFDLPTTYDGYDAVETVAAQPWVKGGTVGMVGISFSGISQVHVAGTQPPHLGAITPLSVTDDLYSGTGYPGGIFNNGFAKEWLAERMANAEPAPSDGAQPWANALVEEGDQHCIDNQKLRLQTQDVFSIVEDNPYREVALVDHRSPWFWAERIEVPVFLAGAFQDEQTGGHFPEMLPLLADNPDVWVTLLNGTHVDSLGPAVFTRWLEFLDLFVADRIPSIPPVVEQFSGEIYRGLASGADATPIPRTRFDGMAVDATRDAYRRDPRVRVLVDNGGGPTGAGALEATWELAFDAWPPREVEPASFFLGADGALLTEKPEERSEASYRSDPRARPQTSLAGDDVGAAWAALPPYQWAPVASGKGLGFTSAPLDEDLVAAGPASLDLALASTATDTDLQVTISDVRPDGEEMYVQSGWLRAGHRALDRELSTELDPWPSHLKADAESLEPGKPTVIRVPIYPFAYAFRAGHRIRITITAPGGDRPRWRFDTIEKGDTENTVFFGGVDASHLVLGVLTGERAGAAAPACPSNRGQPCRTYEPASNGG